MKSGKKRKRKKKKKKKKRKRKKEKRKKSYGDIDWDDNSRRPKDVVAENKIILSSVILSDREKNDKERSCKI